MLYSIGKDSSVMLHLAHEGLPSRRKPPFPLLHVDTTWKFREMYAFRDRMARELGLELLVHINQEGVERGINPFDHGSPGAHRRDEDRRRSSRRSTSTASTRRSAARAATRRSRAPRSGCSRSARRSTAGTRRTSGPELWQPLQRAQAPRRVDPRLPALQLDRARRLAVHPARGASRSCRSTSPRSGRWCERDGTLLMVDDDRMPLEAGRGAGAAQGALPHARLLPADRRGGERRRHARGRSSAEMMRRARRPSARAA